MFQPQEPLIPPQMQQKEAPKKPYKPKPREIFKMKRK